MFVLKVSIARFVLFTAGLVGSSVYAADELILTLKSDLTPSALGPILAQRPAFPKESPYATIREFLHPGTGVGAPIEPKIELSIKYSSQNPSTLAAVFDLQRAGTASPCVPTTEEAIDYLIVTIADPINSHLPLVFDRNVESIQLAAQAVGYVFDRYYFPWEQEVAREEADLDKRRKMEEERKKQVAQPGVLLFRSSGDLSEHNNPLVVFLVLETPTSGVNQTAFANAMSFISRRGQKIPILGPGFSGSFPSLLEAMRVAHKETCAEFDVITGTATGTNIRKWFAVEVSKLNSTFEAVVHDEATRFSAFSTHVKSEWKKQGAIALLVEDETGYGAGLGASFRADDLKGIDDPKPLLIYFPREISRLRNAYQELPDLSYSFI